MADIKARYPALLTDEKYDEWFTGFVTWFLSLPNTPEFCNWLRPGLQALDDTYFAKRIAAQQAEDAQMDASAAWRSSVKALRALLIKLRISLLSLVPGDDSVLHLFRLDEEVPEDPDTLVDYATIADLAWQPHAGEPEYAVFADRLNNIAVFCDDVKAKRIAMRQAITAYSHATDEKTAAREACNERERAIFSFFRGEDLPDGFWTDSMWGLPGGGEEPPAPDWPDWPGPAETFTASIIEPGVVELVYSGVKESTIGWLHRRKVGIVDWSLVADDLPMNAEDIVPFRDYDVLPATWEYRFIPMRGDEHGEASYAIVEVVV